jgi:hypothetical protein
VPRRARSKLSTAECRHGACGASAEAQHRSNLPASFARKKVHVNHNPAISLRTFVRGAKSLVKLREDWECTLIRKVIPMDCLYLQPRRQRFHLRVRQREPYRPPGARLRDCPRGCDPEPFDRRPR